MAEKYEMDVNRIVFSDGKIKILGEKEYKLFEADKTKLFVRDIRQFQWDIPLGGNKPRTLLLMSTDSVCDVDKEYSKHGGMNLIFCGKRPIIKLWD